VITSNFAGGAGYSNQADFGHEFRVFTGLTLKSGGSFGAKISSKRWMDGRCRLGLASESIQA
jgi:hypothetical protein